MKDKLGIKVSCKNCGYLHKCLNFKLCKKFDRFYPSYKVLMERIKKLQEQQFTEVEANTVLFYMKQANLVLKNENERIPNIESIFSKLEKMKGE